MARKEKQVCFMLVSADLYQLPLDQADSLRDLAKSTGLSYSGIQKAYRSHKAIRLPKGRYTTAKGYVVKVDLD